MLLTELKAIIGMFFQAAGVVVFQGFASLRGHILRFSTR